MRERPEKRNEEERGVDLSSTPEKEKVKDRAEVELSIGGDLW